MKFPKMPEITQTKLFVYLSIAFAIMGVCSLGNLILYFGASSIFSRISGIVSMLMYAVLFFYFRGMLKQMAIPPDTLKDSSVEELQKAAEGMQIR